MSSSESDRIGPFLSDFEDVGIEGIGGVFLGIGQNWGGFV